ncbi:MAG: hypothetical protein CSA38_05515 [Flavobacteriales bacterium]|nr:MAG: hypothetical protein CSA38_05515 [Flavobacteriales bacterium]
MHLKLLRLELKSFFRNPQFGTNLLMKIFMFIGYLYLAFMLIGSGFIVFFLAKEELNENPVRLFCRFFIYYWILDLVLRYFIQQMPTQNIKPFLTQNITKKVLVKHTILKTIFHFFNWGILLFLIPFGILNIIDGFVWWRIIMLILGVYALFYFNNFLNILLNGKDVVFYTVMAILVVLGGLEYFNYLQISEYSEPIFYAFYEYAGVFLIPIVLSIALSYWVYRDIKTNFYLDKGLETQKVEGKTENIQFLNRFGVVGTFINNDIRLLKRSKAAKGTLIGAIAFLLYGLLGFISDTYNADSMRLFTGLFVTGGFIFIFGGRVPAWDSQHYPLMMTMNVPYKEYLKGKWAFLVLTTFISTIIASVYIFISWELYLTIFAAGLYNIGVNSYLTLLSGSFNKTPIDLNTRKKSMGSQNNFNMKTILITLPQLLLPMIVFAGVKYFFGIYIAVIALGILGLIGFLLRNKIFDKIVKRYKEEKYTTLEAFKKGA